MVALQTCTNVLSFYAKYCQVRFLYFFYFLRIQPPLIIGSFFLKILVLSRYYRSAIEMLLWYYRSSLTRTEMLSRFYQSSLTRLDVLLRCYHGAIEMLLKCYLTLTFVVLLPPLLIEALKVNLFCTFKFLFSA